MKIKLLLFLGWVIFGTHSISFAADTLTIGDWKVMLDEVMEKHEEYIDLRETRIEALRQQSMLTDPKTMNFFRLNEKLYREYKAYNCDSALRYLSLNLYWAKQYSTQEIVDAHRASERGIAEY